jgi:hypothetical protein
LLGLVFTLLCRDLERKLESKFNGLDRTFNGLESKINGVATMLESKLDGQDRQLDGQDRKVKAFGEKIVLQDPKYEPIKSWRWWFGLKSSPGKSEEQAIIAVIWAPWQPPRRPLPNTRTGSINLHFIYTKFLFIVISLYFTWKFFIWRSTRGKQISWSNRRIFHPTRYKMYIREVRHRHEMTMLKVPTKPLQGRIIHGGKLNW